MQFRTQLKKLREEQNLSQAALAKILGVGQSTVAGWESGNKEPNYTKLVRLAQFFDVSTDYLLGLTNDPGSISMSEEDRAVLHDYAEKHSVRMTDNELAAKLPPEIRDGVMAAVRIALEQSKSDK